MGIQERKVYLCEHLERNTRVLEKKCNGMLIALIPEKWEYVETTKNIGNAFMGPEIFNLFHYFIHTDLKIKAYVITDSKEKWLYGAEVL